MILFSIGFYGWILYLAYAIWFNYFRTDVRHVKPVYINANWARFIAGSIALICMTVKDGFDPATHFWQQLWNVRFVIGYITSSFYLFFDPGLNWLRGKKANYKGQHSGWLDSAKMWVYYAIKILCVIILVWSLIKLL
jgi:hypothetical protein